MHWCKRPTLAEMRTGELLKAIPKATPNNNKFHEKRIGEPFVKPKAQIIQELGFCVSLAGHKPGQMKGCG